MREESIFVYPVRVRYADVDQQGIVHNAVYNVYVDVAFTEFLREKGLPYKQMVRESGFELCHVKSTYTYFASAYEDDLVEIGLRVIHVGNKSFTLLFELYAQGRDELLVSAECVYSGYTSKEKKSLPLIAPLRELLKT